MLAGAEKPLYADVSALADAAADLPITSPLTEGILDIVNAADDWLELVRKTVAKRNSGQKLGKCLQWMLSSLDRALEQFTLRLQVRAGLLSPDSPYIHARPLSRSAFLWYQTCGVIAAAEELP